MSDAICIDESVYWGNPGHMAKDCPYCEIVRLRQQVSDQLITIATQQDAAERLEQRPAVTREDVLWLCHWVETDPRLHYDRAQRKVGRIRAATEGTSDGD